MIGGYFDGNIMITAIMGVGSGPRGRQNLPHGR
jgi:hypothetical protein